MSAVLPASPAVVADVSDAEPKPAKEMSAADRLADTRQRLRSAMLDISNPPKRAPMFGSAKSDFIGQMAARVKSLPAAAIVIESVESWWRQHPLRTVGVVAEEASRAFVKPLARRNPQTFLLGAVALGALFALTRPWRWLLRPALFVGLVPQLASHALRRMPAESWMKMASTLMSKATVKKPRPTVRPKPTATGPVL